MRLLEQDTQWLIYGVAYLRAIWPTYSFSRRMFVHLTVFISSTIIVLRIASCSGITGGLCIIWIVPSNSELSRYEGLASPPLERQKKRPRGAQVRERYFTRYFCLLRVSSYGMY